MTKSLRALITCAVLGACQARHEPADAAAPQAAPVRFGQQTDRQFLNMVAGDLRTMKAIWDGAAIIDLAVGGRCAGTFITARGRTPIRWAAMGNVAPTDDNRHVTLRIPAGAPDAHRLVMPSGDDADGVIAALGLMESTCRGGR